VPVFCNQQDSVPACSSCRIGQKWVTANALIMLGNIAWMQGDSARSRGLYEEALALHQEMERQSDAATATDKAGRLTNAELEAVWCEQGSVATVNDVGGAESALAYVVFRNKQNTTAMLGNLAKLDLAAGNYQRAGELFEQVRTAFAALGRTVNEAQARIELGQVAFLQGNLERARALLEPAVPILRRAGVNEMVATGLSWLGRVAHAEGDPARAVALHRESLALRQEMGDREGMAMNLEGLGIAMSAAGQGEPAVRPLAKAAALREQIGAPLPSANREVVDQLVADLRTALGEAKFAALSELARTTPLEQLLAVDAM
jgi:tetratricopeptide (TPR) repeat protein